MTLLEVLVAMSILSFLLVLIFGFFRELSKIDELTKYQQSKTFHMRYVEYRLSYLFSNLIDDFSQDTPYFFFLEPPDSTGISKFNSLIFNYNNGIRLNPFISGNVLARLYVDKNKYLCLAIWPLKSQQVLDPESRIFKEILLENVEDIKFEFFMASGTSKSADEPKRGVWQEEWPRSYRRIPALIKVTLSLIEQGYPLEKKQGGERGREQLVFNFPLPLSKKSSEDNSISFQ